MANSADQKANEKAKKDEKFNRVQELKDLKDALENPSVQRVMWRFLSKAGLFSTSFTGNSTTFFNEGQRSFGLWMLTEFETAAPGIYGAMAQEYLRNELPIDEIEAKSNV